MGSFLFKILDENSEVNNIEILKNVNTKRETLSLIAKLFFNYDVVKNILRWKKKIEDLMSTQKHGVVKAYTENRFAFDLVVPETTTKFGNIMIQEFNTKCWIGRITYCYPRGINRFRWTCCGNMSQNHDPISKHFYEIKILKEVFQC